ncbi:hypothetical protein ACI6Q2_02960 [Chitinophagaceae bacterium LWZ2-11]
MKTSILRKLFLANILVLSLFATVNANASFKHDDKKADSAAKNEKAAAITFLGSNQDGLVFNVKYDNTTANVFTVVVTDETGEVLYQDSFKDKQFDKKFLLPKSDVAKKISFAVKSDKGTISQNFNIDITTKVVEDVVVSRN